VWSPYSRDLTEGDLKEAQRLGLQVVVWTVNDPSDMASLIDLGVDGLITDYPDRARDVMAQKGMPLPAGFARE
jgi:glycerophosphoryl diester phosphodiesterase